MDHFTNRNQTYPLENIESSWLISLCFFYRWLMENQSILRNTSNQPPKKLGSSLAETTIFVDVLARPLNGTKFQREPTGWSQSGVLKSTHCAKAGAKFDWICLWFFEPGDDSVHSGGCPARWLVIVDGVNRWFIRFYKASRKGWPTGDNGHHRHAINSINS